VQNNDGYSWGWTIILTVFGFFGIINMIRYFKKPPIEAHEEYERIIDEKDKIIADQQRTIEIYEKLYKELKNGNNA